MGRTLSEADVRSLCIDPALEKAGWDGRKQIRREVTFTAGKILVKGKVAQRGTKKRADYILYHSPTIPIAIIEAKDSRHAVSDGIQQALEYAELLDIPFVYSSNSEGFLEHDRTAQSGIVEREISLDEFPSPEALWQRYKQAQNVSGEMEALLRQEFYFDAGGRTPRYYQQVAVNRVIDAVGRGENRLLLVMATGTGKTYTAFQIIWRLWKAGVKKRILFLADRNILVDQTMTNDFKHFGDKMHKITNRRVEKAYEVYLALYQAVTGETEDKKIFKQFSPDFFDLVIVDECHRGSAADDSQWREILTYFSKATQIGMTATPKETKYVSNIDYFGEPVYTYSLRQGIEDGFLAPYKVIRVLIDRDWLGWKPPKGMRDKFGQEIEQRIYNLKDYDRTLVIEQRTQLVANRTSEYLEHIGRMSKTIVFCEDIDHAGRMRQALINENADLAADNSKYIMKITGDDAAGKQELDNFINPEEPYPVIATTSQLMSTGVDAQTCRLIVLDKNINSMTEFKQIIGRGTRVRDDYEKLYFTILDFRNATRLFYDPLFDGDPVQVYEPKPDDPVTPPDEAGPESGETPGEPEGTPVPPDVTWTPDDDDEKKKRVKYVVNNVSVEIIAERVQYYDSKKGLVSVSLKDFSRQNLTKAFASLDDFLTKWNDAERKEVILAELAEQGVFLAELQEKIGKELDPFDLICHVAYDRPPLTRYERANGVKQRNYFAKYEAEARRVLEAILEKYADEGIEAIEPAFDTQTFMDFLKIPPFSNIGTPVQLVMNAFGGKEQYLQAIKELEAQIYSAAS